MLLLQLLGPRNRDEAINHVRTVIELVMCLLIVLLQSAGIGHILEHCPTRPPKQNRGSFKSKPPPKFGSSSISAAATEGSTTITISDIEALLKQVISSNTSTAMSATHGNSQWFFDSACCNHMTTDIKSLPSVTIVSSLPPMAIQ